MPAASLLRPSLHRTLLLQELLVLRLLLEERRMDLGLPLLRLLLVLLVSIVMRLAALITLFRLASLCVRCMELLPAPARGRDAPWGEVGLAGGRPILGDTSMGTTGSMCCSHLSKCDCATSADLRVAPAAAALPAEAVRGGADGDGAGTLPAPALPAARLLDPVLLSLLLRPWLWSGGRALLRASRLPALSRDLREDSQSSSACR